MVEFCVDNFFLKETIVKNIFCFCFLLIPIWAQAESAFINCEKSEIALQTFLNTIPANCTADSDCKAYPAFPGGCKDLYSGNLDAQKILDGKDFQSLRKEVIRHCQKKWNLMGACAPGWNKKKVRCEEKRCI